MNFADQLAEVVARLLKERAFSIGKGEVWWVFGRNLEPCAG